MITNGNQVIIIIPDRYRKLTRAVLSPKSAALHVASILFPHWVIPYGIPRFLLADNGPLVVNKCFDWLCTFLVVKHLTTTAYYPKISGRAEQYDKTIFARLNHCVAER